MDNRQDALIVKSGLYDGKTDTYQRLTQDRVRESTVSSWYQEDAQDVHPLQRHTNPTMQNAHDFDGKYSWATSVNDVELGRCEVGPLARQLMAAGPSAGPWQRTDGFIRDAYKKLGGPSVHLRQLARVHEQVAMYREAERCLRELRLKEPFYEKPTARDGQGWGATEAARGALAHWISVKDGKIENYQIIAPTTWNVGPRDHKQQLGPIETALVGTPIANKADPVEVAHVARSFDSCLVCTVHAYDQKTGRELARFRTS